MTTRRKVQNGEPAVPEGDRAVEVMAFVVGAAMPLHRQHSIEDRGVGTTAV